MKITKATVAWSGLLPSVVQAVREWEPIPRDTELQYRDDLVRFLRDYAPDARVEPEYRHGGTTADICFKWDGFLTSSEIFIEIKRNLRQKPQYDRLVGQIEGLRPAENKVVVVLCGDTNETLSSRLKHHYQQLTVGSDRRMDIVIK